MTGITLEALNWFGLSQMKKMKVLVKNKDTELYTNFYPNKGKETVILLHGGPAVPEDMEALITFLSSDFQLIYFHQRGTLKSPCSSGDFSISSYISDIDCLASHFGLQKFHLFGHSWGGLYGSIYAAQKPEKVLSLFLCSPASGTGLQWVKTVEIGNYNRKRSTLSEWISMNKNALLGMLGSSKAYQEFYEQFAINCNKGYELSGIQPILADHVKARTLNRLFKAIIKYPKLQKQTAPPYPITVTYGDNDIYGNSRNYVQERFPTAKFVIIQNSSHIHWLHNPKQFFASLAEHFNPNH